MSPDDIPRVKEPYFLVLVDVKVSLELEDFEFSNHTDVMAKLHDLSETVVFVLVLL